MIFPEGIRGPDISEGDLVSFKFPDSTLTMRLPKIPYNHDTTDRVSAISDWTTEDTYHWDDYMNGKQKDLVYQTWKYEDSNTHDDIAFCILQIHVQKFKGVDQYSPFTFKGAAFRDRLLSDLIEDEKEFGMETREGWPSAANEFFIESIQKHVLNGLKCLLDLEAKRASHPMPYALFVLGEKLCLNLTFTLCALHYSDRKNPFSDDLLHQFKMDLFDELISHIHIEYSPEVIERVEAMK
jgi:hypothetical protein